MTTPANQKAVLRTIFEKNHVLHRFQQVVEDTDCGEFVIFRQVITSEWIQEHIQSSGDRQRLKNVLASIPFTVKQEPPAYRVKLEPGTEAAAADVLEIDSEGEVAGMESFGWAGDFDESSFRHEAFTATSPSDIAEHPSPSLAATRSSSSDVGSSVVAVLAAHSVSHAGTARPSPPGPVAAPAESLRPPVDTPAPDSPAPAGSAARPVAAAVTPPAPEKEAPAAKRQRLSSALAPFLQRALFQVLTQDPEPENPVQALGAALLKEAAHHKAAKPEDEQKKTEARDDEQKKTEKKGKIKQKK